MRCAGADGANCDGCGKESEGTIRRAFVRLIASSHLRPSRRRTTTIGLPSAAARLDLCGQSGSLPTDSFRAGDISVTEALAHFRLRRSLRHHVRFPAHRYTSISVICRLHCSSAYQRIERPRSGAGCPVSVGLGRRHPPTKKGARYPQRFASHRIVRSGQTQLKRAADQLQAPTSLVTRWNLPQAPK
jgi:hypothetical protein